MNHRMQSECVIAERLNLDPPKVGARVLIGRRVARVVCVTGRTLTLDRYVDLVGIWSHAQNRDVLRELGDFMRAKDRVASDLRGRLRAVEEDRQALHDLTRELWLLLDLPLADRPCVLCVSQGEHDEACPVLKLRLRHLVCLACELDEANA